MDVTPRERLVRAWFDSWLRGELDDIAALFTP